MDTSDFFRKLCVGVNFDVRKFKKDAERFEIIKTKRTGEHKSVEPAQSSGTTTANVTQNQDPPEPANDKSKKKKKVGNTEAQRFEEVCRLRKSYGIKVKGSDVPYPVTCFDDLTKRYKVPAWLLNNVRSLGYAEPTPVQMQAIPAMMERRELMCCAPTGSGKTAAFLIPLVHHLKQPCKVGFRGLIVAPTRELARQTCRECLALCEGSGLRVYVLSKTDAAKRSLGTKAKFDILVTTPNRLVYLLREGIISLKCVEWLVVDESDKLFEAGQQGFRDQLAEIYRACCGAKLRRALFSATAASELEEWCRLNLDALLSIYIGPRNCATEAVEQELMFVGDESGKLTAFRDLVRKGLQPPVLVFTQSKERARELFDELIYDGINVDVIHSERTLTQRDNVIRSFRSGKIWVLICTDLMARGIDFKGVSLVLNYDVPPSVVSYVHRVGRSGRAGHRGRAVTFFTEQDVVNIRSIARVIAEAGYEVPQYLLELPRPSKNQKRDLLKRGIKRHHISTLPKDELAKQRHKRRIIERSRKQKKQKLTGDKG
ncbi:probable ATP-dependent RNA helicase DDX52 [Ornithodoros turicata]|uniref:probable ATP-dependent RNA helicase DDX52 n=1 Tax=Ornithodoros turicata TaxID=34597 RepID=UPI003139E3DF